MTTSPTQNIQQENRDYLFDNIKAVLIFLVVLGHILPHFTNSVKLYELAKYVIYSFHMPMFVFITGYFSKNAKKSASTAFVTYFIPFLIFSSLYTIITRGTVFVSISIFRPSFALWFLISVFFWKILLPHLCKIRWIIPLSIALTLYAGLFDEVNKFISLSRTLAFFPFFLVGYFFNNDEAKEKIKKLPRWLALIIFLIVSGGSAVIFFKRIVPPAIFEGARGYKFMKLSPFAGMSMRFAFICVGLVLCLCIYRFAPRKKLFFTKYGKYTITIYLLHTYLIKLTNNATFFYDINPFLGLAIMAAISALAVVVLGNKYFNLAYIKLIQFLTKLLVKKSAEEVV